MTSALLPLLLVSRAHALETAVEICFEFQIDFSDVAWGDHWVSNANRVARGVEFQLTDDVHSVVGHMSATDGCVDLTVTTSGPDHRFDLVAWPRAEVNGIELESYYSDTFANQTVYGITTHRLVDCGGTLWVDTAEPASTYLDATNWLDDVETHTGNGCARDTDAVVEANRSTVYDVAKMFFRLTNTSFGGRNPAEIADLYVDTCPRGWQERDDGDMFGHVDERPLERLRISAEHHLLDTALVFDHVEH